MAETRFLNLSQPTMRILILTQWYPPEPALLMHEMAQELQSLGHQVQVLTGFPNYPNGILSDGYKLRPWQKEKLDNVNIIRTWLYPDHSKSGLKRVLNYLSFATSAFLLGSFLAKRPDVIFVYHPPLTVAIPAWILSRIWRVPFVYQIQDMWPETLTATGMINNSRVLDMVAKFARLVYSKAAHILVISEGFRKNLLNKGVSRDKISVISNWVDSKAYSPVKRDETYAAELGIENTFNVMFAGNMGKAQALETVVEAAELLKDRPSVRFVMVGDGIAFTHLRELTEKKGLKNVLFLGRFKPQQMPKLYALADALLIHLRDDPLFRITIPHKTFVYMAVQKPIITAVAGNTTFVVEQAKAGLSCQPQNAIALANTVKQMAMMDKETLQKMGDNGREEVLKRFNRPHIVRKIAVVLENAIHSSTQK